MLAGETDRPRVMNFRLNRSNGMEEDKCDALFNTGAICDFLRCSKTTFYKWIRRGLPANKEGPGEWSASKQAINEYFYNRSRKGKKRA